MDVAVLRGAGWSARDGLCQGVAAIAFSMRCMAMAPTLEGEYVPEGPLVAMTKMRGGCRSCSLLGTFGPKAG